MTKEKELVKVQFYDPDIGYENLWGNGLGKNTFRIESIPFFIYGVSRDDIVSASPDGEGRLQFGKVLQRSGNRTLRARSPNFLSNPGFRRKVTTELKKRGCDVEELRSRLLAVHVPANVDIEAVTDYFTDKAKVQWEYGDPENLNKNASTK